MEISNLALCSFIAPDKAGAACESERKDETNGVYAAAQPNEPTCHRVLIVCHHRLRTAFDPLVFTSGD